MSCEGDNAGQRAFVRPARGVVGWRLLVPIAAMFIFYGYVAALIANPRVDEAYRRTFLTSEFSVFPTVKGWQPGDGLDYPVGTYVDLHRSDTRQWLARLDWHHVDAPNVMLRGTSGRLFLRLTGEADPAAHPHRLTVGLICALSAHRASEIEIAVNGRIVASTDCGEGPVSIEADLPPGSLGRNRYDEIAISREEGSVFERIVTRLGLRAQAVELASFSVDAE